MKTHQTFKTVLNFFLRHETRRKPEAKRLAKQHLKNQADFRSLRKKRGFKECELIDFPDSFFE